MPDNWFFTILFFFVNGMAELLRLPLASLLILALSAGMLVVKACRAQLAADRAALALEHSNQRLSDAIKPFYHRLDQAGAAMGEFETALLAARRIVALYGSLPGEQRAITVAYLTFFLLDHSRPKYSCQGKAEA